MDEMTAAALLMKLEPKAASALLSEVAPVKAARLAALIAAVADLKLPARPEKPEASRSGPAAEKAR